MCKKECSATPLAKQKHAEFMLKMAEIIYGIVFTGLLGTSVLVWFSSKEAQTNGSFGYFLTLSIIGAFCGVYWQQQAMATFNQLAGEAENKIPLSTTALSDTTNPLSIQFQHGTTHISINIQSEKNNAQ
jgi:hypothetical protein